MNTREEGLVDGLQDLSNYVTAFLWGIGMFFHWWSVFGPDLFFGKQWEEKKIKQLMDKQKEKTWE